MLFFSVYKKYQKEGDQAKVAGKLHGNYIGEFRSLVFLWCNWSFGIPHRPVESTGQVHQVSRSQGVITSCIAFFYRVAGRVSGLLVSFDELMHWGLVGN